MRDVRVSRRAAADIRDIYLWSRNRHGRDQAEAYYKSFQDRFSLIAAHPMQGRDVEDQFAYRRVEHREHTIFYRVTDREILIVRVLHKRMNVAVHPI